MRDTYPVETAWAPKWVGDELRQVRAGAQEAHLAAIRAAAEATAAKTRGRQDQAAQHEVLAASYQAMRGAYRERETVFAGVADDRSEWGKATAQQRRLAVATDTELRRRDLGQRFEPLRSAEPDLVTDGQRDELTLTADQEIPDLARARPRRDPAATQAADQARRESPAGSRRAR